MKDQALLRDDVARLSRVLANEGVMDAFGHASLRHPARPDVFFLPRTRAPELVVADDVLAFGLDGDPLEPTDAPLFAERFIHAAIYAERSDVGAVCHHHAAAILPFCLTDLKLVPVTQLGAAMGANVRMWDSRDRFGATNHLVKTMEEGVDLARTLGDSTTVLMRRHGATVVAKTAAELAFRAVYTCRNAETQLRCANLGSVDALTDEEAELAGRFPQSSIERCWDLWTRYL